MTLKKVRKKMKIKIEMEIENCYDCPFVRKVYEQGYCATECKYIMYGEIPKKGIRKDCPFLKKEGQKG